MLIAASRRIVGLILPIGTCLGALVAAGPAAAKEPIRLPAEPISVAPRFEPENLPHGFREGDPMPAATLTTSGSPTRVGALAYSPDGSTLAVGDGPNQTFLCTMLGLPPINENGGLIRIVDLATRRVVRTIRPDKQPGHEYDVVALAYTPDGKTLVAHDRETWRDDEEGDCVGHLTTVDLATGRVVRRAVQDGLGGWPVAAMATDGSSLALANGDGPGVWDVATGGRRPELTGAWAAPTTLAFSPDGKTLALDDGEDAIGAWDVATGRRIARFPADREGRAPHSIGLTFAPDGRTLAARLVWSRQIAEFHVEYDTEIRLLDLSTNRQRATIPGDPGRLLECIAFSSDGATIATTAAENGHGDNRDADLRFWDAATGRPKTPVVRIGCASKIAFSRDGSILIAAGEGLVAIRDPVDGRERFALHTESSLFPGVQFGLSPDGRTLATTRGTFRLWDLTAAARPPTRGGHRFEVTCLAYSPDGRTLASASLDRTVKLWDLPTRRPRATLLGHDAEVVRLAYAPDGRTLASVDARGTTRTWDAATGAPLATLHGPDSPPLLLAYSPDGRTLTVLAGEYDRPAEARRWDAASGEPMPGGNLAAGLAQPLAMSSDGRLVISANKAKIEVRDASTAARTADLTAKAESITVIASTDGETILQMAQDRSIVVHRRSAGTWRSETLFAEEEPGIESRTDVPGLQMAATPDARLVAARLGETVQVFDTARRKPLAEFPITETDVTWLAFSPDGKSLATGRSDGEIVIHDLGQAIEP